MKELYVPHLPKFTKTACGWSAKIETISLNKIEGTIYIQLSKNKTHTMSMEWDNHGMPIDIKQYPSKYYLRLV